MSGQVGQQAVGRPVEQVLVQQQLHPDGDAKDTLGDELGWPRGGDDARVARASAAGLVTPAADDAPMSANIDLDNCAVLGAREGLKRQAAARANFVNVAEVVGLILAG